MHCTSPAKSCRTSRFWRFTVSPTHTILENDIYNATTSKLWNCIEWQLHTEIIMLNLLSVCVITMAVDAMLTILRRWSGISELPTMATGKQCITLLIAIITVKAVKWI